MTNSDAYRLELQTLMLQAELNGDIDAAETYQQMIEEFDENCED
jgi:hypothetical protein